MSCDKFFFKLKNIYIYIYILKNRWKFHKLTRHNHDVTHDNLNFFKLKLKFHKITWYLRRQN